MSQVYIDVRAVPLVAGEPEKVSGSGVFLLMESAAPVNLVFRNQHGNQIGQAIKVKQGFKVPVGEDLTYVEVTSAVDQTATFGFGLLGVDYLNINGAVTASIAGAAVLNDAAPVAVVAAARELLAAADTGRRLLVIKNTTADYLYIGGAAVDDTNSAIVLEPGDEYTSDAPQAAHYGYPAATGSVNVLKGA
jgi:hypothetical protein